jgi:galactosylceramidase
MSKSQKKRTGALLCGLLCFIVIGISRVFGQSISINGAGTGRAFDGVGSVSGGGATSVFLKDYPEPQRTQLLDYLFKPKFGASMNTLFFEIGGDCNATQGSEPSHMHTANDQNYQRGYEWWLIKEAKARNANLTLDGVAWGCPGWVGGGNFWSTDMQNYYVSWIKGLKSTYGFNLDAIGCRNESGTNYTFPVQFKALMKSNGLTTKLHGFDNWGSTKWDFVPQFNSNAALKDAIDVMSAHTTCDGSASVSDAMKALNKPIWDTEEHAYKSGYLCEQLIVNDANKNYINSKITKTVFWYLIEAYYEIENFHDQTMAMSNEPWSGHYQINPGLWGYAHYNQFVDLGWQYIDGACGNLSGGGTYVTLKSPANTDFSVIVETYGSTSTQTLNFTITGGLPTNKTLCVWRSKTNDYFSKQADITPTNGTFSISVDGASIYSISTTTGQQKGTFATAIPASKPFPPVYYENYDHYTHPEQFGYLPYYHADINGVFEIANRPDGTSGKCLHQVLTAKANSWANEWAPFTIFGNTSWADYEVSADVYFDPKSSGYAAVMGRVNYVGDGYHAYPKGYYLKLSSNGAWALMMASSTSSSTAGSSLASGTATLTGSWHNVKLQFSGSTITGYIENKSVCTSPNASFAKGMAALATGDPSGSRTSAYFDNLIINTVNGPAPTPTDFAHQDSFPPYSGIVGVNKISQPLAPHLTLASTFYKVIGGQFVVPKEFAGKTIAANVYDLKGKLVQRATTKNDAINLRSDFGKSNEVFIVKLKALD